MTDRGTSRKGELLGRELRRLRKERKLALPEVAERSGIDAQEIGRIERGETRVGLETLFRLLSAFEVEAGELRQLVASAGRASEAAERFRRELSR